MPNDRDALITGIGLVSCLGSGIEATWTALQDFHPVVDADSFPPFLVHPLVPLDLDKQIPKRGDQRQMEPWQRMGVFAAGLALESAGLKGNADLLGRMDMIVAAGGGERDYAADSTILSGYPKQPNPGAWLNERLLNDLRPTLFLAQLSNLLAGNISIVHGVTGSSRTFMGEESAGADAIRIACARIAAGQGDLMLVGGSYNAQRPDVLLHYEMGGLLRHAPFAGVWERQNDKPGPAPEGTPKGTPKGMPKGAPGGMVLSSVGCFLVIESRRGAAERGVTPFAHVAGIRTDRCRRDPGQATANAQAQLSALGGAPEAVISAASGAPAPTQEEAAFLANLGLPVRAVATAIGHSLEPAFPAAVALAALAVKHGSLFPPLEPTEAATTSTLKKALVTGWGHWRGEAMALVEAA